MSVIRDVEIIDDPVHLLRPRAKSAWAQWHDWQSVEGATLPNWQVFSPMQHTKWLPQLMLWNIKGRNAASARIILTGQDVARHLGIDSINERIDDVIPSANIGHLVHCLQFCADNQQPSYMIKSMEWRDRGHIIYDSLLLPFWKDEENIRILGLLHFDIKPQEVEYDL